MALPDAEKYDYRGGRTVGDPLLNVEFVGARPERVALILGDRATTKPAIVYPTRFGANNGAYVVPQGGSVEILYKNVGPLVGEPWTLQADGGAQNLAWIEVWKVG